MVDIVVALLGVFIGIGIGQFLRKKSQIKEYGEDQLQKKVIDEVAKEKEEFFSSDEPTIFQAKKPRKLRTADEFAMKRDREQ